MSSILGFGTALVVIIVIVVGIFVSIQYFGDGKSNSSGKVWSPEHGHYH